VAKELAAARGFRRPGRQLALVTVERDRVHLPGEARIRRDDAALVVELDDLAAYGEALVLGRFAVFVVKDRPRRRALTLAATSRSLRDDLRVAPRQCTQRFPFRASDERAWSTPVRTNRHGFWPAEANELLEFVIE
jgi:hypothetical protein